MEEIFPSAVRHSYSTSVAEQGLHFEVFSLLNQITSVLPVFPFSQNCCSVGPRGLIDGFLISYTNDTELYSLLCYIKQFECHRLRDHIWQRYGLFLRSPDLPFGIFHGINSFSIHCGRSSDPLLRVSSLEQGKMFAEKANSFIDPTRDFTMIEPLDFGYACLGQKYRFYYHAMLACSWK